MDRRSLAAHFAEEKLSTLREPVQEHSHLFCSSVSEHLTQWLACGRHWVSVCSVKSVQVSRKEEESGDQERNDPQTRHSLFQSRGDFPPVVLSCIVVMLVMGLRLSLCTAGVLQLLSATGSIFSASGGCEERHCFRHVPRQAFPVSSPNAHLALSLQLTSESKTFWRVAEELSWSEALKYCRWHHTDLADLHSMSSIRALYSLTSSHEAWIGLFFDVHLGGLRWSGGSSFSALAWGSLLTFREGLCATLYSITFLPSLGAAWCAARRPFICYFDPTVRPHTLLEPVLSLTATPKPALLHALLRSDHGDDAQAKYTPLFSAPYGVALSLFLAEFKGLQGLGCGEGGLYSVAHGPGEEKPPGGCRCRALEPQGSLLSAVGTSFGPADAMKGRVSAGPFPQQVSPEPSELSSGTLGPSTSASAGPPAPQPRGTASLSPPAHVPIPLDGGPWTLPVTTQNMSFGPAPPASSPTPTPSPTELVHWRSPTVPQGVTETPLASTSSPTPGPAPPEDSGTQGGPGRPQEDAAGPSLGSTPGASAHLGVAATPGAATSSGSRGAEPPGKKKAPRSLGAQEAQLCSKEQTCAGKGQPRARPQARRQLAGRHGLGVTATPGAATSSGSSGAEPPGTEESTAEPWSSGSSAVLQRTNVRRKGPAQSQAAGPETAGSRPWPDTAVTSERSGTNMTGTAPATQAQHWSSANHPESTEKTPAPKPVLHHHVAPMVSSGHSLTAKNVKFSDGNEIMCLDPGQLFGILKADFLIPVLMDPEDMKDQFLSEVRLLSSNSDQSDDLTRQSHPVKANNGEIVLKNELICCHCHPSGSGSS
ncbi:Putative C-type lectin domain-containing protein NCRNA00083 [Bos mutus]|uniref:Putative C-type lectin domain-containing protein NCRNA00083 n=1 Tax=Bos mutus TaxID=72004 RepID=L8HRR1_9CETA|nr:Putative C-type lectin domain-containing protein NCRNA00083 [Bos mutus]